MSYRGDQIADSIQRHTRGGGLDGIVQTLLRRNLGEKHFESAKNYMKTTLDAAQEKIQWHLHDSADVKPGIALRERELDMYLMYMAVNANDHNEYVPAIERILITRNSAILRDRPFPLRLYAPHLEFRHVQRSAKVLEYNNSPFKFSVAFALLLSKALEDQIPMDSAKEVPVMIPQPNGMFLGTARRVAPSRGAPPTGFYVIYDENEKTGRGVATTPEWDPAIEITAKTYIHSRDFFGNQRKLHQMLMPFYEEPVKLKAMNRFVDAFEIGSIKGSSLREIADINTTLDRLRSITQDRMWGHGVENPYRMLGQKKITVTEGRLPAP